MAATLGLDEAAVFLKTTPETVSDCIHKRGLPAVKIGRAWVLVEQDVIAWLREQYSARKPNEDEACGSTSAVSAVSGGLTSPSTARALNEALAPRTKPRRGSGPPRLRAISGGNADSEKPQP